MSNRFACLTVGAFVTAVGLSACTGLLPPALYPSPADASQASMALDQPPVETVPAAPAADERIVAPVTPAPATTAPATAVSASLSFQADVVPIVRQHCAACHSAGGPGASKVLMFDASGTAQAAQLQGQIGPMIAAVNAGRMPLGQPNSVPASQMAVLTAWQTAGAPIDGTFQLVAAAAAASATPSAVPTASPSATPTAAATAPAAGEGVYFRAHVAPILAQHCKACHVTGGIGPFALFDAAGNPDYETAKGRIAAMVGAIETGKMPMGQPGSVPAAQLATLKAWQAAGMPLDPGPAPEPTPEPTAPSAAAVSFQAHVVPILKNRCSACHMVGRNARAVHEVAMFDASGRPLHAAIADEIDDMIEEVEEGEMPMGAPPGTVQAWELDTLRAWYRAGRPNN